MKNKVKNIAITVLSFLILLMSVNSVMAAVTPRTSALNSVEISTKEDLKNAVVNIISTLNSEGLNQELLTETTEVYKKASEKYSNEEIAVVIKENKETLEKNGVDSSSIDIVVKVLNNISTEQAIKILENVDIEKVGKKIEEGTTVQEIVTEITSNLSTTEKVDILMGLVTSIKIIQNLIMICLILFIYRTLLRCVIYKKAGRPAWAPFIPIYRNVVMLKVCGMSPWWLLLLLVPIIGWIILWLVSVASKFMLAEKFGKGVVFSFGLLLLPVIFETILIMPQNKYIKEN